MPQVFIHSHLHTSGADTGNHEQLPVEAILWVIDMCINNASQTCCVWRFDGHWPSLALF